MSNEGNRLVLEQLFEDALEHKQSLSGTLMGAERSKAYVRLDLPPIDVKVYLKLAPTVLVVSPDETSLLRDGEPAIRLGDRVELHVHGKHPSKDRWVLAIA